MGHRKLIGIAMVVASAAASSAANAQAVNFQGAVTGCFYTSAVTPLNCAGLLSAYGNLVYTGSTFNVTSNPADGIVTLGRSPATPNINNLGSFTLTDGTYNYTGQKFALFMTFTAPSIATGNNAYTSVLTGNLTALTNGNVFVDFDNTSHTFTFSNGTTLVFNVNDVSINDDAAGVATVAVTGQGVTRFATTTTPEPSSLAFLGTGLAGLLPLVRRRKV